MKPVDLAAILTVMVIWGFNFPLAKLALSEFPPLLFMAVRFVIVSALLCPFVRFPRAQLPNVLLLAFILGGVHFGLFFSGLARMDAGTAAILTQMQVPFGAILAAVFYRDRLGWRRFTGMVLAFLGTVLILGEPRFSHDAIPPLLVLAAVLAWAFANIQIRRIGPIDGLALTGWLGFFAVPQLLLLSYLLEKDQLSAIAHAGWRGWTGILYGAIAVAIVSYQMWYPLVRRYPVNQTMPFTLLVPFLAVVASALLIGDEVDWQEAVGGLATMIGVAVIVLQRLPRWRLR